MGLRLVLSMVDDFLGRVMCCGLLGVCGWVCLLLLGFGFWFVSCWCGFVWLVQCRLAVLGYLSGLGSY